MLDIRDMLSVTAYHNYDNLYVNLVLYKADSSVKNKIKNLNRVLYNVHYNII